MSDIYFDNVSGDIVLSGGDLLFTSDVSYSQTMLQRIRANLLTFLGEWFLDVDPPQVGVPYFQSLLSQKLPTIELADSIFRTSLINIEGVTSVENIDLSYDTTTRVLSVSFRVTIEGDTIEDIITFNNL